MLPDNVTRCCPHLAHIREIGTSGIKHILDCAESMQNDMDNLPDDLKPYAQVLNEITMQVLIEVFIESLRLYSELSMQEIVQAAIQPNHQTEPDLLERSMNDAI